MTWQNWVPWYWPSIGIFIFIILCFHRYPKSPSATSRKHTYVILAPLNPFLYSKTGVYRSMHYFSYFGEAVLTSTHDLGFWAKIRKLSEFLSENVQFLLVKFSIYFSRRVFVIIWSSTRPVMTDQGMWIRRQIWLFTGRTYRKVHFLRCSIFLYFWRLTVAESSTLLYHSCLIISDG